MEKKNINEVIANLSVEQLAGMIDHTFLKPFGTAENIEKLCAEARQYPSTLRKWKSVSNCWKVRVYV